MKKIWALAATLSLLAACSPEISWTEGPTGADGRAVQTLTLKNMPGGARIWFQEMFDNHEMVEGPVNEIHHFQGTTFWFDVPEGAGREFTVQYKGRPLPRRSWAPEGFVLQVKGREDRPIAASYTFRDWEGTQPDPAFFAKSYPVQAADLIPVPKRVSYGEAPAAPAPQKRPAGWYRLTLDAEGKPSVESADEDGARYAAVTLAKLPEGTRDVVIEDWPDLGLRGFMLDVVRDFRPKEEVLKLLDIMASYKLNLLHFHLGDDESWCLEIPQIPELTSFGAHHELPDWDLKETRGLKPQAGGRIGVDTYYTQEEYKEILRYAWSKGIAVVPEFDAPGHSRAAIRSVEAYIRRSGDESYRLQDPADTSRYWSAQDFKDNVLSIGLPGVYKFYGLVFDEVKRMHAEAGVPLKAIHIGGDEVPDGAWAGQDKHALKDLFTRRMLDLAREKGVKLAGWQELVQGIRPETLEALKPQLLFVNAWSTLGENAKLTYQLANDGIPVLLSNVQHAYIDLAYSDDPKDIGLHWGGYVNEISSFSLQPWNICEEVKLERPENIVGAEALLWSENLRCFDNATYQMLPKALGIWERAWNSRPSWPTEQAFREDFDRFYSIVAAREMPLWEQAGYCYKKRP